LSPTLKSVKIAIYGWALDTHSGEACPEPRSGSRYSVLVPAFDAMTTWIPDRLRNDMRHFHASLRPFQGMAVYMKKPLPFTVETSGWSGIIPSPLDGGGMGGGDFHPSLCLKRA